MKLSTKKQSATQRVLIYGPPKTGKTELCLRLAEKFDVTLIDMENGFTTGLKLPVELQERINVISLPDSRVFPVAIETVLKLVKGGVTNICQEHGKVDCSLCKKDSKPFETVHLDTMTGNDIIVFDSLTQLTNSAISHITKGKPDDYKLDYDDWAMLGKLMDMFLSQIQQAGYNVVCISHETEVEMEDGKKKLVPTAGTARFSRNTAKYFDHVIYAEIKNKKHMFSSGSTASLQAITGSRTDAVLEKDERPSLLSIFKLPTAGITTLTVGEVKAINKIQDAELKLAEATSNAEETITDALKEMRASAQKTVADIIPVAEVITKLESAQPAPAVKQLTALEKLKLLNGKH